MGWRGGVALGVAVGLLGLLGPVRDATDPAEATPGPPNILFVLTDDQSFEALPYGLPLLDSEPGGHWVRFENAFFNTSLCCPSRATMLTGQYAHHHRVLTNKLGIRLDDTSTVATWLDDAGYRTGLVGKYLNQYPFPQRGPVAPPGWDTWVAFKGAIAYKDFDTIDGQGVVKSHPQGYSTDVITKFAERFVDEPSPDPFFLFLAYNAPHAPGTPAPRHQGEYRGLPIDHAPNFNEVDVSDKPRWVRDRPLLTTKGIRKLDRNRRKAYESLLAVDEGIAQLFESLDDQGSLDDTIVVFMTDNGFSWGEHRFRTKPCPYEECSRTPLLIRYPDGPESTRTVDDLVSNIDIAPTLTELAGATPASPVDGTSLVPFLEETTPDTRDGILLEWRGVEKLPSYWGVRTTTHKWVEYDNGEQELYDLIEDPYELENLAGTAPALEAELHDLLVDLRSS